MNEFVMIALYGVGALVLIVGALFLLKYMRNK